MFALSWGIGQGWCEESSQCDGSLHSTYTKGVMRSTSNCDREAAAARAAAARAKAPAAPLAVPLPGGTPNYFGPEPNYANSPLPAGTITSFTITSPGSGYTAPVVTITDPACAATATATLGAGGAISLITLSTGGTGCIAPQVTIADTPPGIGTGAAAVATIGGPFTGGIRKFMDTLPGLGSANPNNLGNYIPVAVKDTTSYPGSDYYRIGVVNYSGQMHFDLPATTQLRGYKDLQATGTDANPHYLGPMIIAKKGTPTRLLLENLITPNSAYFMPVDTTIMGAGMGPLGAAGGNYSPNRVLFHLHGGDNPWISDGTPHQWVTPPAETTSYLKGVSFKNVSDMIGSGLTPGGVPKAIPAPADNDGLGTYYYPDGQSSRLMFYHEHSYGITRQGVYAGAAAPYLLWDQVEEDLISGTNASGANPALAKVIPDPFGVANPNYHYGIPLVLQDKTFVPNTAQLNAEDPTWNWGPLGNLWFPHVYMTNQNPADAFGMNAVGRWDYGPWFWPPMDPATLVGQPYACPTPASPTQVCPGTPNPSIVPEAFMDTPIVNGEAYPILQVAPQAYRFRILNASNDRTLSLQLYYAATSTAPYVIRLLSEVIRTQLFLVPALRAPALKSIWLLLFRTQLRRFRRFVPSLLRSPTLLLVRALPFLLLMPQATPLTERAFREPRRPHAGLQPGLLMEGRAVYLIRPLPVRRSSRSEARAVSCLRRWLSLRRRSITNTTAEALQF